METARDRYARSTRAALLAAGRRLFAERGYADIAAEELVRAAGLTRGALYHHFDGKRGLFEAVLVEVESEAVTRVTAAMVAATDPFARAQRGAESFLDLCVDSDYRHVVLLQGPVALGWQRLLELDRRHLGEVLLGAVQDLLDAGLIRPHPAELVASAFFGALTDLAFAIVAAADPQGTRAAAADLVADLLTGLRPG